VRPTNVAPVRVRRCSGTCRRTLRTVPTTNTTIPVSPPNSALQKNVASEEKRMSGSGSNTDQERR
jgi:hypothetical protein